MNNIPGWPINWFMATLVVLIIAWYLGCLAFNHLRKRLEQRP